MEYERKIVASCETFGGFEVMIDIRYMDDLNDIYVYFKNTLLNFLFLNNLHMLRILANNNNFHIHSKTFEYIITNPNETYYICNHEH